MANNFESNITRKVARVFLDKFESERVLSKNVNTQLLQGKFKPSSGDTVDFKRPTDYRTIRTTSGDVSAETPTPIITGKASGVVQEMFTELVEWDILEEAIEMDQMDQLLAPMATRMKTDIEVDFADFMRKNSGLLSGTYGTPADTWDDIALAGATMQAAGIPMDNPWYYTVNPYTQRKLASNQRSLGAGGSAGSLITESIRKATIQEAFAGFDKVMTATTLSTHLTDSVADRVGALAANPLVTYVNAKDTMQQVLSVSGFGANLDINAGEVVQIAGRYRLNLSTRKPIVDETGNQILFTGVVVEDVTLDGTGAGLLTVAGPAIYEATGTYNTVASAPISGDVVTLLGAADTLYQPNLFWHKNAFGIGSVKIPKLHSTDTVATTEDGLSFRVSKGSGFRENTNEVRIDFLPAYAVLNPFFAGHSFGE